MSYLVLARKYRPHTFADVVGQQHVIRPLVNALRTGRLAHAYLFAGARGVGKTTAARLLAMALNCLDEPENRPCGQCDNCREIIGGQAVDVFEIDGASNRGINEIRDLRETIKYLPSKGRSKVYVIDEVHMLTKEAFNALLKTLEEPPEHVVFIFATTEAHKVLPTILSRCQRYDFKRIKPADVVDRLVEIARMEDISISDHALRLLSREADGSLRDALSLFDQVIAFCGLQIADEDLKEALGLIDADLIVDLARSTLRGDAGAGLDLLDQVYQHGYDAREFAAQALSYFRNLVVVKVSDHPENILDCMASELAVLKEIAEAHSLETLNFHFNAWLEMQGKLQRAAQPRLILEALLVRLAQAEPVAPLAELTAKLDALLAGAPEPKPKGGPGSGSPPTPPQGSAPQKPPEKPNGGRLFTPQAAAGEAKAATAPQPLVEEPPPTPAAETSAHHPAAPSATEAPPPLPPDEGETALDEDDEGDDGGAVEAPPAKAGDYGGFLELVRREAPFQSKILEKARVRAFGPERVEMVLDAGGQGVFDQERLKKLLSEFFDSRPTLRIDFQDLGAFNGGRPARKPEDEEKARETVLNHPRTRELSELFSGELVHVELE
jgi:DNA polymerase-3 subunit gamma/tau